MAYALHLAPTTALFLLTLSACNPAASPTNNAALAAEQNSAAVAATNNQAVDENRAGDRDDDHRGADMMHDSMMKDDKHGMGNMPKGNMPAMKDDPMSNSQSMNTDKPMADDMDDM